LVDPGILEYITEWSRESNLRADGSERININASRDDLATLITDLLGSGVQARVAPFLNDPNRQFSSLLEFYIFCNFTAEEFAVIEPEITVESGAMLPGKVNVNTAPAAVLACIPGIGDDKAE